MDINQMLVLSRQTDNPPTPGKLKLTKPLKEVIAVLEDNKGHTISGIAKLLGSTTNAINDRMLRLENLIPLTFKIGSTSKNGEVKVWYLDKTG